MGRRPAGVVVDTVSISDKLNLNCYLPSFWMDTDSTSTSFYKVYGLIQPLNHVSKLRIYDIATPGRTITAGEFFKILDPDNFFHIYTPFGRWASSVLQN